MSGFALSVEPVDGYPAEIEGDLVARRWTPIERRVRCVRVRPGGGERSFPTAFLIL
jgi:hypothetical protein